MNKEKPVCLSFRSNIVLIVIMTAMSNGTKNILHMHAVITEEIYSVFLWGSSKLVLAPLVKVRSRHIAHFIYLFSSFDLLFSYNLFSSCTPTSMEQMHRSETTSGAILPTALRDGCKVKLSEHLQTPS